VTPPNRDGDDDIGGFAEPTPEELSAAEALARGEGPEDTLAVAALLRHAKASLDPARSQAIRDALPAPPAKRRRFVLPTAIVASAAAITAILTITRGEHRTALPRPGLPLLAAQAEAAQKGGAEVLSRQMQGYRSSVLATLARRYR
jgi:hypothetical protein